MTWRIISRLKSEQIQCSVAGAVGVVRSVFARLRNRFQETEETRRRPGQGRASATAVTDDWYILLTAHRNRRGNATHLQRQLLFGNKRKGVQPNST